MTFFKRQYRAVLWAAVALLCAWSAVFAQSGTFSDARDGKKYRTVKIGGAVWMAQNLEHQPRTGNSWCYKNDSAYCGKYGRMYDWETAKAACPSGWRLPTRADWGKLAKTAGGSGAYGTDGGVVGSKLKSTSGWGEYANGTDKYGFSALPGGCRFSDGTFVEAEDRGVWWTATEKDDVSAYVRSIDYGEDGDNVFEDGGDKSNGASVRCVQN